MPAAHQELERGEVDVLDLRGRGRRVVRRVGGRALLQLRAERGDEQPGVGVGEPELMQRVPNSSSVSTPAVTAFSSAPTSIPRCAARVFAASAAACCAT
jgi:hypothetical protein